MNTEKYNKKKRVEFLRETIEISKKVDETTETVINLLNTTNLRALDPIKPLIQPRRNIYSLMGFYELFWNCHIIFEEKKENIKKLGIVERSIERPLELEELEEVQIIPILNEFIKCFTKLREHPEINIIKLLEKENREYFDLIVELISRSVIHSLERLPKVVDKIDIYSKFVVKNGNEKEYLSKYSKICQSRLGFFELEGNFAAIIQQTKDLTKHFNMIKDLNNKVLGEKKARAVNEWIVKFTIIDLKNILTETLLKIEKKESSSNIIFLIELYLRLRHTEGDIVEEIEELFVLKPEILKLIFNSFINYIGRLSSLDNPRSDLRAEELAVELTNILHLFTKEKGLLDKWVNKFGFSFGVSEPEQLAKNFSEKCLQKIFDLSDKLDVHEKCVYLINNLHIFRDFLTHIFGLEIQQQIYKYCRTIIGYIKIQNEDKPSLDAYNDFVSFMHNTKNIYVPVEEKIYLKKKLKKIIDDLILKEHFEGNLQILFDALESSYGGN